MKPSGVQPFAHPLDLFICLLCYLLNDLVAIDGSTWCADGPIGKFAMVYRVYKWPSASTG